uniref:Uncharacterized protein n=1 Tax=Schizaphis graminum TaxID=13262 RepID=A0A2S2PR76_SCHGA
MTPFCFSFFFFFAFFYIVCTLPKRNFFNNQIMGFVFHQVYDDKSSRSSDSLNLRERYTLPGVNELKKKIANPTRAYANTYNICPCRAWKKLNPQIKNARSNN